MALFSRLCLSISVFGALIGSAHAEAAEPSAHVSVGLAFPEVDLEKGLNSESIILRGGYEFDRYLGVEAEALIGIGEGEVESGTDFRQVDKLKSQFGAYGVLTLPLGDRVSFFTRAGYASLSEESTVERVFETGNMSNQTFENKISGPSFGLGLKVMFGKTRLNGIRLDATGVIDLADNRDDIIFSDGSGYISAAYIRRF